MDYYFSEEGDGKTVGQSHTNCMTDASLIPCPYKNLGIIFVHAIDIEIGCLPIKMLWPWYSEFHNSMKLPPHAR